MRRPLSSEMAAARYRSAGVALDHVMAADEIERADKTAVTSAIAKATFYPTLAVTEELQQQVQDFDRFCGVARVHDNGSRSG
jgi:hypothetical protein